MAVGASSLNLYMSVRVTCHLQTRSELDKKSCQNQNATLNDALRAIDIHNYCGRIHSASPFLLTAENFPAPLILSRTTSNKCNYAQRTQCVAHVLCRKDEENDCFRSRMWSNGENGHNEHAWEMMERTMMMT